MDIFAHALWVQPVLQLIHKSHPAARIEVLATPGLRLSEQLQDGRSLRYAIVNIGGRNCGDVLDSFGWCVRRLPFTLEHGFSSRSGGGEHDRRRHSLVS